MAKSNNVIAEIQELVRQIKNEYREGVDYITEKKLRSREKFE